MVSRSNCLKIADCDGGVMRITKMQRCKFPQKTKLFFRRKKGNTNVAIAPGIEVRKIGIAEKFILILQELLPGP